MVQVLAIDDRELLVELLPSRESLEKFLVGRGQTRHSSVADLVENPVQLGAIHLVQVLAPDPTPPIERRLRGLAWRRGRHLGLPLLHIGPALEDPETDPPADESA